MQPRSRLSVGQDIVHAIPGCLAVAEATPVIHRASNSLGHTRTFMVKGTTRRTVLLLLLSAFLGSCAVLGRPHSAERSTDPRDVVGKTWQWEGTITPVEKFFPADPARYTILLREAGRLEARFDCNRGGGTYEISAGKLTFGPLISTRMACPPDSLDGVYMKDLQRVASFFLENGKLYLELPVDSGTMHFRSAP